MLIFHVKVYDSLRRYTISKDEESSFMQKQSMLSNNIWHRIECVKRGKTSKADKQVQNLY